MIVSPGALAAALGQFPPTPEQSAVIAAPLAPALVVAGAGSGKTETMAGRVVWLVANRLVPRSGVLGLTFTRKAAGELGERIRRRLDRLAEFEDAGLVPYLDDLHRRGALDVFGELERAGDPRGAGRHAAQRRLADDTGAQTLGAVVDSLLERPTVSTYNSFADGIVRENAVRIGRDPEAAVLSESAAWLLMRRVVLDSDDERLETRENALRSIIDGALRIARDGVDNLVDFAELARFGDAFQDVLERPSTRSGTTVYADVARAADQVSGLPLLADLALEYQRRKLRSGVIDFSDQVAGALAVVRAHPGVAADLRERYPVVLLDEYQDTSVVQTELLSAVFAGASVMAVGDPHQSIYGWRGASAGNLGDFAAAFSPAETAGRFSLATSWRNSERILDAANAVLAPLAERSPVPVDRLRPRPSAPAGDVELLFEPDLDTETDRVAAWFERVRGERAQRGAPTSAAILLRSKKHMVRYADALARRGIPHRILGLGGLLSTPEVVDVVSALRVISDPTAGSALLRLLGGPRWSIGLRDLRSLADLGRRLARSDAALQPLPTGAGTDDDASIVDALDFFVRVGPDHGWLTAFTDDGRVRLREAAATFAALRRASSMPIPELVRLIEAELRLDIELAANESRGSARVASDQLRAFVDELQGFLATDEAGSLPSLLAWLDHAERQDEFAPRTEPPEEDVVQILTIHGSKGLEWDAVAVGRVVADELPARARDKQGWLGFGVLPYGFRGDARWLPRLTWEAHAAPTQQDLKAALARFADENADRQREEERRLAYVAVTRARDALLLSGSFWSGTRNPRGPSPFLREIADGLACELVDAEPGENPYLDRRQVLEWPLDPLGERRTRVESAARAVRAVAAAGRDVEPERDLALLLAERDERAAGSRRVAPTRIPASRFKDFAADYDAAVEATLRPLPERPYRETRLGTRFHAWVEQRSGVAARGAQPDAALWEVDDDSADASAPGGRVVDGDDLARLQEVFLRSEWATLQPIEVETEIDFTDDRMLDDGRPHVIICKLDAVYRRADRGGRIEIVDWKTGRPPRTAPERAERMLQLELYRRAYSVRHGIDESEIDVALFYVADDLVIRG
ncbi:ATP-dependent DNA helicase [Microbacterium sp. cf332]|uniref:ATP-dependent DNA helicase n=1 Tax=Microbacterium sp. cf332 TaxID=1761804 RepID=UPI000880B9FA|nr:ATP-dependent DNA helicase [Microbacterium sp. cf332]SDQ07096.1 DNA helicase-2 / ATP-dependent DNA helicase PcrA [Microbacterium sp. cf332]